MLERCLNHPQREASARCPACRRYYCRECVTEHDGRVLCERCLRGTAKRTGHRGGGIVLGIARGVMWLGAFLAVWLMFFGVGRVLLIMPSNLHDGTFWKSAGNAVEGE